MQNLEKKDISAPPYQYSQPQEPSLPPALSKRPRHGPRTAAIVALTLLLAIVFGTGLFAGWEFGSRNAGTATSPTTIVQSGTDAGRTIPPLTKDNAEGGGYRLAMYARWDLVLFRSKSVTRLYVLPGYLSPTYR